MGAHHPKTDHLNPPWPKGVSGNPRGRPKAGAVMREWLNVLASYSAAQLRTIARSEKVPAAKRAAAMRLLDAIERPDIKDFELFLTGNKTLDDLAADGVDTTVVKAVPIHSRLP